MTLLCKTDDYYEYCSWTHNRRKCDFEWKRAHVSSYEEKIDIDLYVQGKVLKQGCHDDLRHRVSIVGHYDNHECGLQIKNFSVDEDAGQWLCEMEEYKFGGSRGHVSKKYLTVRAPATTTTTTSTTTEITRTTTTEEEMTTTEVEMTTDDVTTAIDSDDIYGDDGEEVQEEDDQSVEDEEEQDITTEASDDNSDEEYDEDEYEDIMRILEINGTKTADNIDSPEQQTDQVNNDDQNFIVTDQLLFQPGSSVVGVVCGVVVAVLATAAVVGAVLVWRRRRRDQGVITMSKILEESEARGAILEEAEVTIKH